MINKRIFHVGYTSDNEPSAKEEVKSMLESIEGCEVIGIDIVKSNRACRNAYGKEMDEGTFDSIDTASEEAWFNDYEFVFKVNVNTPVTLTDEEVLKLLEQAGINVEDEFEG